MTTKHTPVTFYVFQDPDGSSHYLTGAIYRFHECGCTIVGAGTRPQPLGIQYCSKHSAAPDLLAALEHMDLTCSFDALNPCWDDRASDVAGKHWGVGDACPQCCARAAIKQAKGE